MRHDNTLFLSASLAVVAAGAVASVNAAQKPDTANTLEPDFSKTFGLPDIRQRIQASVENMTSRLASDTHATRLSDKGVMVAGAVSISRNGQATMGQSNKGVVHTDGSVSSFHQDLCYSNCHGDNTQNVGAASLGDSSGGNQTSCHGACHVDCHNLCHAIDCRLYPGGCCDGPGVASPVCYPAASPVCEHACCHTDCHTLCHTQCHTAICDRSGSGGCCDDSRYVTSPVCYPAGSGVCVRAGCCHVQCHTQCHTAICQGSDGGCCDDSRYVTAPLCYPTGNAACTRAGCCHTQCHADAV